ncbi:DMT family transporter [Qingshengfaniella alkalisoli]|uniref:DMT family transporter n=1 Tax=Qingshengfaniella alkalisoli TaxID=2599296 RepID=A0A5B8IZ41_9RHOB|nr:DMT family transporter [Qingshengfaniella alkalisoli]QDY70181.1 DMT family transporter [Qingshengfaniella alkalisoli]
MVSASDNMRAAGLMTLAMACFTLNDTCMKAVSDEIPIGQALFIRGGMSGVVIGIWAYATGALRLHMGTRNSVLVGLRTLGEVLAAYFFISALFNMPLANATAILQALPLVVTLAGALFMGEPLGWRRIAAILVGFVGVMLIVRPGPEGFNIYALFALAAVLSVTLRDLVTRGLTEDVPSLSVAFYASVGVMVLGLVLSPLDPWQSMSVKAMLQITGSSLLIIGGYILSIEVMRIGEIGFVAPFRYTGMLWALAMGFIVFGEWPAFPTMLGASIVVATGIYTFYRERKVSRLQLAEQCSVAPAQPDNVALHSDHAEQPGE